MGDSAQCGHSAESQDSVLFMACMTGSLWVKGQTPTVSKLQPARVELPRIRLMVSHTHAEGTGWTVSCRHLDAVCLFETQLVQKWKRGNRRGTGQRCMGAKGRSCGTAGGGAPCYGDTSRLTPHRPSPAPSAALTVGWVVGWGW
jgi:hypothetical protein